ncbi:CPBP family intramembrane glutamic endopeptidase [Agreia sp. Leaf283]|uniref:CPBP family intramembrane glutamic endopeptidase n=1 Tax=Agreia sp. Leaf283 TaxID=1736321 RepID=UPI0006FB70BD|nr:CPBP family intramembrane glutamic endopeptidase [Agreia sp. Leaf283]KQP53932.1 hypothetical protein ASF51_17535 [Agreia sp. Leaf283]
MSSETEVVAGRPRSIWMALAAVVIYVLLAAGLGNLLSGLVGDDQPQAQFALVHFIPLAIAISLLLLFLRWASWGTDVWRERPTPTLRPRRWWLVAIPVLAVAAPIAELTEVPWAETSLGLIAIIALGTLMVGFGEELVIRGILLTAVRARHGEFVTLLITTLVFAFAHIPGSIIDGVPPAYIAFQVAGLSTIGATYYWVRRVTGRLWAAMLVHAFTDFVLYLGAGSDTPSTSMAADYMAPDSAFLGTVGVLLWIALAVGVVSVIREDRRAKRQEKNRDNVN